MIEALVQYFEKHGFHVAVLTGALMISKSAGQGVSVRYSWAISQLELQRTLSVDCFYKQADDIMRSIDNVVYKKFYGW